MMTYGKIINGQIQHPPEIMRYPDGMSIVRYPDDVGALLKDGYLPIVYEQATSGHGYYGPRNDGDQITMVWTAVVEPDPLEHYAGVLQSFGALWASLEVGPVPSDWTDAMELLSATPVESQIKLLAYRVALAPVWDAVLERLAGNA